MLWLCTMYGVVLVPDPKPTPARITFSIIFPHVILEAIYAPDEVWGRDYVWWYLLYQCVLVTSWQCTGAVFTTGVEHQPVSECNRWGCASGSDPVSPALHPGLPWLSSSHQPLQRHCQQWKTNETTHLDYILIHHCVICLVIKVLCRDLLLWNIVHYKNAMNEKWYRTGHKP